MIKPAIAVLAFLATPAFAQEKLDLLATTIAGLSDNGLIAISPNASGEATKVGEGSWEVATNEGLATFVVTEPEECLFEMTFGMGGATQAIIRFNFNLSTGVEFTPAEPMIGLDQYTIVIAGEGDVVQFAAPGGEFSTVPSQSSMATSLPIADVQAAAAALETACPKP